jgi:hypothetical protein
MDFTLVLQVFTQWTFSSNKVVIPFTLKLVHIQKIRPSCVNTLVSPLFDVIMIGHIIPHM